ncbi:hypothetical protein WR25_07299 [Diploscapter pachys]|uniref:Uncharacterized protein n=1 Tax=Diploscapter pachys TaxID=2018661 RepID=A0A2A2KH04_9BILA|nr:hypothetical protein WR25_07299 [Diploscapter pachys]
MEDFTEYRQICANRLRRLERYKKARSFCNLEEEVNANASLQNMYNRMSTMNNTNPTPQPSCSERSEPAVFPTAFDAIREKMVS